MKLGENEVEERQLNKYFGVMWCGERKKEECWCAGIVWGQTTGGLWAQRKQRACVLLNPARPQELSALLTKTQKQAGSVCAYKYICICTCVWQCLFKTTTQHRKTSVSASVVGANLGSDQTSLQHRVLGLRGAFWLEPDTSALPALIKDFSEECCWCKGRDIWAALWGNEDQHCCLQRGWSSANLYPSTEIRRCWLKKKKKTHPSALLLNVTHESWPQDVIYLLSCTIPKGGGGFIEEIQPFRELMRPFGTNSPGNLRTFLEAFPSQLKNFRD